MEKLIDEELKLCPKLKHFMNDNGIELLFELSDFEEAIQELRGLSQNYEEIHVNLKRLLGDTYKDTYDNYDNQMKIIMDWNRNARIEIRKKKQEEKEEKSRKEKEEKEEKARKEKEEKEEKARREKEEKEEKARKEDEEKENKTQELDKMKKKLVAEEYYSREKMQFEIQNMEEEDSCFVDDIERNIILAKDMKTEYVEIFKKIYGFGDDFRKEFGTIYEEQSEKINVFVKSMMKRVQVIKLREKSDHENYEKALDEEKFEKEKNEKIEFCENLFSNISDRFSNLEKKCSIDVKNLTEFQVMENNSDLKNLNSEFNDLLDRITKLSQANPSDFQETKNFLSEIEKRKVNLKTSIDLYKSNLGNEIVSRDLSPEKIKNASIIGIELPKFKGYDSPLDYYSFKSEFEKLISPRIPKPLLPDYLKNNYLQGQALQIVKEIHDLDKIWERLKISFGNVNVLLSSKLSEIEKNSQLFKIKNDEKLVQSITKLKNSMKELAQLAQKHDIEGSLYHSSNVVKIFNLIGHKRKTDITKIVLKSEQQTTQSQQQASLIDTAPGIATSSRKTEDQIIWQETINYLENEQNLKERLLLFDKSNSGNSDRDKDRERDRERKDGKNDPPKTYTTSEYGKPKDCIICGKSDHIATVTNKGNLVINYFACEKFVKLTPRERLLELKKKGLCFQCLTPGLKLDHKGICFDKYKCPDASHGQFKSGLHVLICEHHKNNKENLDLLESYKKRYIDSSKIPHRDYTKNISISFHADAESNSYRVQGEELEMAIYMLQTIELNGKNLNLFYDTGCGDMVCRKEAVDWLIKQKRAKNILDKPIILSGVGDKKSICEHGKYQVTLPLANGKNINLSGICLDKITGTFPPYPLSEVETDIRQAFAVSGGDPSTLPKLPKFVGGNTDIMLGIQYLKYYPKKLFSLPNGLSIYESQFKNVDGSRGIVGGPHKVFSEVHKSLGGNHVSMSAYLSEIVNTYQNSFKIGLDIPLLGSKDLKGDYFKDENELNEEDILSLKESDSLDELKKDSLDELGHDSTNSEVIEPKFHDENILSLKESDSSDERNDSINSEMFDHLKSTDELPVCENDSQCEIKLIEVDKLSLKESDTTDKFIDDPFICDNVLVARRPPRNWKKFEKIEAAGTEVSYRCVRCRGCKDCKCGEKIEFISIQEEVEQSVIDKSVKVNLDKGCTTAKLPFICDPTKKLKSNENIAKTIYFRQIKKLNLNQKDKEDVILAEKKLHDLNFVEFVENLTEEQRKKIFSNALKYFIPWRAVWNGNSLSTPCRPVFDASHPTSTGVSLNMTLAKGRNNMNKLLQILIRWRIRRCGFHTDIQKMYNAIKLEEEFWSYQLYFWQKDLDPNIEPLIKVIKTLIYGVTPSGNQAERALRETANLQKDKYPRQCEIVNDDAYVDDIVSGEDSYDTAREVTDGLEIMLNGGGFRTKGVTFSGFDPPDNLSNEDKSVNVAGLKWFPKSDCLTLNVNELNFSKKCRGKKLVKLAGIIPEKFTRRDCAARVAEVFDILGRFTPITAGFKLDLSELSKRKLDWNDFVPDDLVPLWEKNFELIPKLGKLEFSRVIVPEDAINLDMETIEVSDASLKIACSAVYVRFKRKSGTYSCQLLFSRSKIVPDAMSIPRAELLAAVLNASTGHVVYSALGGFIKNRIHLTDSMVVLCWINNATSDLNMWVRNRVIEINRLTNRLNWYHIATEFMIADLATRKGVKISDISEDSIWVNNHEWAKYEQEKFPITSIRQIKLSKNESDQYKGELAIKSEIHDEEWISKHLAVMYPVQCYPIIGPTLNEIGERYLFSEYLIDPNKFRFRKVVRILGLVFLFVKNLLIKTKKVSKISKFQLTDEKLPNQFHFSGDKFLVTQGKYMAPFQCKAGLTVELNEEILMISLNYFFRKGSLEIKHFLNKNSYKNISKEKNSILYYTGRILSSQKINNKLNLADVCLDLSMTTFCVPLIEKYSPLAYAIVNEIHWYSDDAMHSGLETVMRYVQKVAYVIDGRPIVKKFGTDCPRCLYLKKKSVDVAMGPISNDNLRIAPAFYISQVDLFGPFNSYSHVNKRATVKIWFVVFCCCTTGAIDIKVTEDYSANSFILGFIRFSCKVGYPRRLLPDPGSQLLNGCGSMKIKFSDISNALHEYGVSYEVCPVGAHYMHGKVERKIKHIKESISKHMQNERLSIIQWETLGDQVANSINNLPISIGNVTQDLENIDLLTPNRLLLARNNERCPVGTVEVTGDLAKMVQSNKKVFDAWFRAWLVSYVPTLISQPKWFKSDRHPKIGDVILFLKSDREFDKQYQYGIIVDLKTSRDGKIRQLEIEYQNHTEKVKRRTTRGTREIVVIHPVDELGLVRQLNNISKN